MVVRWDQTKLTWEIVHWSNTYEDTERILNILQSQKKGKYRILIELNAIKQNEAKDFVERMMRDLIQKQYKIGSDLGGSTSNS